MARTIELTEEQLDAKIAAASKAGAEAAIAAFVAAQPKHPEPPPTDVAGQTDAQFQATMADRRGQHRPPAAEERIPCRSHETQATFTARVVRNTVVELLDYTHPPGHDKHAPDGIVPHGFPILDSVTKQRTPDFKQWLWTQFWQTDLRAYIGKPLPRFLRIEQAQAAE